MHGLIFVTWEQYLSARFGPPLLAHYRQEIGETESSAAPLVTQIYDDAHILAGVAAAAQLTTLPTETLLREYGRYFMLNGLTSHLCAYLLNNVHTARELLLTMRQAHAQFRRMGPQITPPLFTYEFQPTDNESVICVYDSPRHLCDILVGAIEGAAERYGEEAEVQEISCMKQGAATCRFLVRFHPSAAPDHTQQSAKQHERWRAQQAVDELVYAVLPERDGSTLAQIYERVHKRQHSGQPVRLHQVFEALNHLQHAGWATSTAMHPGMEGAERRYWRLAPAAPSNEATGESSQPTRRAERG